MKLPVAAIAGASVFVHLMSCGCARKLTATAASQDDAPAAQIEEEDDLGIVRVDHPERFSLATAQLRVGSSDLTVTGVVAADISRNVPVVSMCSGRIVEIRARLGDTVRKGQVLMKVQSADLADAFSDYRQALADEKLAVAQLARSKVLYEKGAIAQKDVEIAQDEEEKADVAVETAADRLRVLGADKDHPTSVVDVVAPVSGIITDQQVTAASGTQGLDSPSAFTISDLSRVWILCDVHENDLASINVGEGADIRLNAYPRLALKGSIGNIGPILDPAIRTAKVRIEMENPGMMRLGMFVEATFHGPRTATGVVLPASAVLHLRDRDWVYVAREPGVFHRVEVRGGQMIPPDKQEIVSGIRPGQRVVSDVLLLESASGR